MEKRERYYKKGHEVKKEKREGEIKMQQKKCPHCHSPLRYKGPKDGVGTIYWKCRNKKCGRTVELRREPPKTVIPLVYVDRTRGFHG